MQPSQDARDLGKWSPDKDGGQQKMARKNYTLSPVWATGFHARPDCHTHVHGRPNPAKRKKEALEPAPPAAYRPRPCRSQVGASMRQEECWQDCQPYP